MAPTDTTPLALQYKGRPVQAFQVPTSVASTSTNLVDVQAYNAIHIDAYVLATSCSFDLIIEGSNSASGVYMTVADSSAVKAGITANTTYNVLVGAAFARARIANVSGTFLPNQGIQVYLTPYIAGGTNTINTVNYANENLVSVNGSTISLGQTVAASSLPVTIASNQGAVPVNLGQVGAASIALGAAIAANSVPVVIATNQNAVPVTVPVGQAVMASSTPVVIASNQTAVPVYTSTSTSATSSVAVAQASTQLLAANANRRGATIYNDATAHAHIKLGATATLSDFTVVLQNIVNNVGGYYEVPAGYTGIVSAYLGAAGTGNWRITELT